MTWLFELIPVDYFLYAAWGMIILGIVFYFLAKVAVLSVYYKMAELPLELLSIVSIAFGVYLYGNFTADSVWQKKIEELEKKVKIAEQESAVVNTKVIKEIQVRNRIIHDKKIVVQERIKEVAAKIDSECIVDKFAVDILNNASVYPLPQVAKGIDKK
jgi:hypothetical protein